ncbi:hypothetical protein [Frankia sp. AgKG'84/4]|uniref:hypothetical protein n=1 Tax=Frankia sp. AgKG'84/4 TaxID=573490 RepID=UPI00200DC325|nr:hypothetical protein [Frankia sp. AgKG'84/4]MCL9795832.1 hypothetical protein [Frankia sp. AgKG'84/4]
MTRTRAPWQHPALTPVYAAVIAFGVVVVVWLSDSVKSAPGPEGTVTVRVTPSTSSACLVLPKKWKFVGQEPSATPTPAADAQAAVLPECGPAGDEADFSAQLRVDGS